MLKRSTVFGERKGVAQRDGSTSAKASRMTNVLMKLLFNVDYNEVESWQMITRLQLQDANNARSIYNSLQDPQACWMFVLGKNKHSTGLRITGQYFFFFIKCQIIWRRKDCLDVDVCLVATLSVTLAFMIEQSEPVGDSSHEHCSAETEESQHRAVFYRWDGGQSWHCLPLLYTCTLPRECLGCQAMDSAPHVESREEDLLFGLTPITRSHHPLSDIKHFCVSTNMICCNFMKSLS